MDQATVQAMEDLVEALHPLEAGVRPMFGGYCLYVDEKVVGLINDGRVFIKRSLRDDLLDGFAELFPAYPGAKDTWRLPIDALECQPDRVRDIVEQVAAVLPRRSPRKRNS